MWRVGPIPCAVPPTGSNLPFLNSLGDTAVDFDIAPPRVVASHNDNHTTSIVIHYSSMDVVASFNIFDYFRNQQWLQWVVSSGQWLYSEAMVLYMCFQLASKRPSKLRMNLKKTFQTSNRFRPQLQGPLSVYPATDDNYGLDSCSIVILPSLPPTIVLSESTGRIHHALLMDIEEEEEAFNDIDTSLTIYPCQYSVQVLETVELELGISGKNIQSTSSCPVHLKR